MAGHLGATLLAGYFLGEELTDLDDQVYQAIERDLDRITQGAEGLWYDAEKVGIEIPELFRPFPDEAPQPEIIANIAGTLSQNVDQLRQSGHNVIFAALALRALHGHPSYATPSIVGGIVELIRRFHDAGPGRGYFGQEKGWIEGENVPLARDAGFPPYRSLKEMTDIVIDQLISSAGVRRQGFGGLFHIINHAQALTELSRWGYPELAQRGLAAHHQHVRLWRSLPDVEAELGALRQAEHDPRTPEYWRNTGSSQWSAHLSHRIKTLYGFFSLLRWIQSPAKRQEAEKKFLYLMA
jgi:hypothetical protein